MKVAFFLPSFPEVSETFILRQATGLLDLGHDVRIYAHRRGDMEVVHPAVETYRLLERTRFMSAAPPARGRRLPAANLGRAARAAVGTIPARSPRKALAALARVAALAHEPGPDVVHCHYGDTGLLWGFAAKLWRAPLVVSFYGYDCSVVPARHGVDVYRPLFRLADRVTVLSRHMESRVADLGCAPDRSVIQPLGVDPSAFAFRTAPRREDHEPARILSVARMTEKKGLEDALHAVAALHGKRPVRYDVVGDGLLAEPLRQRAAALGIQAIVYFHGALPEADVAAAMRAADIFLLPSVTAADGDMEGTPTVLIEAAATGLPVVSTRHAGIPDIVVDGVTGVLVPEHCVPRLTAALEMLIGGPDMRERMGRAARTRVEERFNIHTLSRRLVEVYRDAGSVRE